jgi:glycosyltransferase involved in cell wall biosynthesis
MLSYARAIPWVFAQVWRASWLYIFVPGHLPILFVAAARLLRRPYGIYLRGECGEPWLGRVASRARFAVAANERMRSDALRHCPGATLVAPMLDLWEGRADPRPARRTGPWRLLFVGRVEALKGVGELLDAMAALPDLDLELDLVGWAPEMERYRDDVKRLGLSNVRFHGVVMDRAQLRALYERADLFVLPTHTEGFPRVVYEAMACGCPILITFVGGIPTLMRDGINCLEIPVRDAPGLARVLRRALADPSLRERIASGGAATLREVLHARRPSHARQVADDLAERGVLSAG